MSHDNSGFDKNMEAMGVSLAIIFLTKAWFGHLDPSFSAAKQQQQDDILKEQYDIPRGKVYERRA